MRSSCIPVLVCLLLLVACSGQSVKAPIDSRSHKAGATRSHPAPASARTSSANTYTVVRGDTLHSIAWQHGLGYRELAAINDIRPPYTIYSGQRLRISKAAGSGGATAVPLQQGSTVVSSRPVTAPVAISAPPAVVAPASSPLPASVPQATAGPAFNGKWVWPARGRLLSRFQPNATGKRGIEIGGHADQPVKAAANGAVVYAGSGLVGYGRLIIIKHNENLLSAYGHNSTLLVAEGEHVTAGQMIAKMGSSGTSRTELYFEIRKDGKPVDPLKYLPRK